MECGADLEGVYLRTDRVRDDKGPELARVMDRGVDVFEVEPSVLDAIADTETPQGILAVARVEALTLDALSGASRVVVLDAVQDPGNAGAVVRTAVAAGFDAVVAATGTADLLSPKAIRSSAGTVFALDVVRRVEMATTLDHLCAAGHTVAVTAMGGEDVTTMVNFDEKMTLVLGSESAGVSAEAIARADHVWSVPMATPVESLNVAVSAGIVMYAMRQR